MEKIDNLIRDYYAGTISQGEMDDLCRMFLDNEDVRLSHPAESRVLVPLALARMAHRRQKKRTQTWSIAASIAVMLLSAITVVRYTVIPLLLVAINVTINAFFESKLNKLKMEQIQRLAITDRAYYYLVHGLSDIRYGKDIRLFDAKNMMTATGRYWKTAGRMFSAGLWK